MAASDLPDPLENRAATADPSPDDLLSRMADDAIDKLIAEADAMHAAPVPSNPAKGGAAGDDPMAQLDSLLGPPTPPPADAAPTPADAGEDESLDATLDNIFAAVTSAAPASPNAASEASPLASSDAPSADRQAIPQSPVETAPPTTTAPAGPSEAPPAPSPPAHDLPGTTADVKALLADDAGQHVEKSSLLLKPLEVLSAPLTHVDDRFRNAVGQIAILTLLNAIAVLIYVFVVRGK